MKQQTITTTIRAPVLWLARIAAFAQAHSISRTAALLYLTDLALSIAGDKPWTTEQLYAVQDRVDAIKRGVA